MQRKLFKTGDGSYTLQLPEWDEQYHSKNGAVAEALHVFIKEGLSSFLTTEPLEKIKILEIGFGTGLNALLTFLESNRHKKEIFYTGVEGFPLQLEEALSLKYPKALNGFVDPYNESYLEAFFSSLHQAPWEKRTTIEPNFHLLKQEKKFHEIDDSSEFDLIYFDAFGIRVQPELWTEEIFLKMYNALKPQGVLVTYAANGNARRAMQAVGFTVEKRPGPPGKKEMLRAKKN